MSAPLFLVRGAPTPEELAAVVAVVSAREGATAPAPTPRRRSLWATPVLRPLLPAGPGAWRASSLLR